MSEITVGSKAPTFTLTDKNGVAQPVYDKESDYTVVYFYPKDDTPGCTVEAQEFNGTLKEFGARKARVVGISGGDDKSKTKFCKKFGLDVTLLSDPDFKVASAFGCYGEKKFMGRAYKGIFRKTFLIDKAGKVAHVFEAVKPEGHAEEVLSVIDTLRSGKKVEAPVAKAKVAAAQKKAASVKSPAKTVVTKKAAPKKTISQKSTPKKTTTTKKAAAVKKATTKKVVAKKPVAKSTSTKKGR
jgi:peroxiredoxin Q/BCP